MKMLKTLSLSTLLAVALTGCAVGVGTSGYYTDVADVTYDDGYYGSYYSDYGYYPAYYTGTAFIGGVGYYGGHRGGYGHWGRGHGGWGGHHGGGQGVHVGGGHGGHGGHGGGHGHR